MMPEFLQVAIVGMMIGVPVFFIYKKAGLNPAWAALVFLPGLGLFLILLQLAYWHWPNVRSGKKG
jgi:hypothetical protein